MRVPFAAFSAIAIALSVVALPSQSIPTAQSQSCTTVSTTGLTGHWKFDEGTGTTTADSSGDDHTGTLQNGTAWTASGAPLVQPNPSALSFDGTNDQVRVSPSNDLRFGTGSFTVSLFARTGAGNRSVLGKFSNSRGWGLYFYPNQVNFFAYGDQGTNDVPQGGTVTNNQWHHVAGVFSRSGSSLTIRTYVDGALAGTSTSTVGNITNTIPLYFGHYADQPFYEGALDDIRIYRRALSGTDVQSLAAGCINGSSSSSSLSSGSSISSASSAASSISSSSSMSSSSNLSSSSSSSVSSGVVICHRPPGNPNNAQTITVSSQEAVGHFAHGDTAGPCSSSSSSSSSSSFSSSVSSSSVSSASSLGSSASSLSSSVSSVAGVPTCNGMTATIYVANGRIVGGRDNGDVYRGRLRGEDGHDVIVGTNGEDRIRGGDGNDIICSLSGDDDIRGNDGNDWIDADGGEDDIRGDDGDDTIYGGGADDDIRGGDGNDTIFAGAGDDELRGNDGDDVMCAQDGNDEARGDDGGDRIDGGSGTDEIRGSDDNDQCVNGESVSQCEQTTGTVPQCSV